MKPPLTIGFNVPFHEAIAAAKLRGVVLPDVYYGELQGLARQLAFSIAGIASLDQLQAVKDSLSDYMAKGGSFNSWKKQSAQLNLELPAHRMDNIWRTNLQGNYMRGKWEQFQRNADTRPYLLYDAINDSRVRPSHLAHDGTIRRVNDAFWKTHSPPLGYRCRCSLISLTEEQAQARSRPNSDGEGTGLYKTPQLEGGIPAEPDKGWDYNPFEDRIQWVNQALERFDPKLRVVGEKIIEQSVISATLPIMSEDTYAIAKSGGDYAKHYERYKNEYTSRLKRAIRSYDSVIKEHQEWIENPYLKLPNDLDETMIRLYVEKKWPADISRNKAYRDIIIGILLERSHDN